MRRRRLMVVKRPALAEHRSVPVPEDFSEAPLPALQLARAVAPRAWLVVLHAYEAPFERMLRSAGVDDLLLGSASRRVLADTDADVLVLP